MIVGQNPITSLATVGVGGFRRGRSRNFGSFGRLLLPFADKDLDTYVHKGSNRSASSQLKLASSSSSSSNKSNKYEHEWKLANDFPIFLNQCTIQTFVFLLKSMKDPHTVKWIDEFTQPIVEVKKSEMQKLADAIAKEAAKKNKGTKSALAAKAAQSASALVANTEESYLEETSRKPKYFSSSWRKMAAATSKEEDIELTRKQVEKLNQFFDNDENSYSATKATTAVFSIAFSAAEEIGSKNTIATTKSIASSIKGSVIAEDGGDENEAKDGENEDDHDIAAVSLSSVYGDERETNSNDHIDNGFINSKLLSFHGLNVVNTTMFPTWQSYFEALLKQPIQTFVIESWAAYVPEYELDINPPSLCTRMISVREQIAKEFVNDLGVIAVMGNRTMERYWDYQQQIGREEASNKKGEAPKEGIDTKCDHQKEKLEDDKEGVPKKNWIERENLEFLGMSVDKVNHYASSPLRKGNFDLLLNLITQESILRILNDSQHSNRLPSPLENLNKQFLLEFYTQRLFSHFDGDQSYRRADDFIEELLLSSPQLISINENNINELQSTKQHQIVDPSVVAELVLRERDIIALEWLNLAMNVPNDHVEIRRLQFELLMKSYGASTSASTNISCNNSASNNNDQKEQNERNNAEDDNSSNQREISNSVNRSYNSIAKGNSTFE